MRSQTVRRPFWPTSPLGTLGVLAFAIGFVTQYALVNVAQIPFLRWVVVGAAVGLTATARFLRHDRSTSVLIVLVLTTIGLMFSVLFLAGEVFIGHD